MRWSHLIATDKSIVNLHELKYFKSSILLCYVPYFCAHLLQYSMACLFVYVPDCLTKDSVHNLAQQLIKTSTTCLWGYQPQNTSKSSRYFYHFQPSKMRSMNSFQIICVRKCFIDYCIIWWCCCACVNLLIVIKNLNGIYCMYQLHIKFVLRSSMNTNRKFL